MTSITESADIRQTKRSGNEHAIAIIAMAGALFIGGTVGVAAARSRFGHAAG